MGVSCLGVSGPIGAGKTTIARAITGQLNGYYLYVPAELQRLVHGALTREKLRAAGDELSVRSGGRWLADIAAARIAENGSVVIDAIRRLPENDALRSRFAKEYFHVHLWATQAVLADRLGSRVAEPSAPYNRAVSEEEPDLEALALAADLVIDSSERSEAEVIEIIAAVIASPDPTDGAP